MSKTLAKFGHALHPSDVIVSATGGLLELVSSDGELLSQIAVPAGRHRASLYTDLVGNGESFHLGDGLVTFQARNLRAVTVYPDAVNRQSDANPDWTPSHMTDSERRMRALMVRKRESTTRNERRAAAQKSLDDARAEASRVAAEAAAQAKADAAARQAEAEPRLVE